MRKKVAIELFGEMRFWDYSNFAPLVELCNENDLDVEMLGTFWNDEYTRKQDLSCFKKLQLINPITPKKRHTLEPYFYSLRSSNKQRLEHQRATNTEYLFIMAGRTDVTFNINNASSERFKQLIESCNNNNFPWVSHLSNRKPDVHAISTVDEGTWFEDKFFIMNEYGLNTLSDYYDSTLSRQADSNDAYVIFRYHRSVGLAIIANNVKILEYPIPFTPNLIRHTIINELNLTREQEESIRHKIKEFQDYSKLKQFLVDRFK